MKKLITLFLSIILMINFVSCSSFVSNEEIKEPINAYDSVIKEAIDVVKDEWKNQYEEHNGDAYFEIKNTRVIEIKDNDISVVKDVKYIVEFILFTDYYGNAPYYSEAVVSNVAVIYKNGNAEITGDLFRRYSSATYSYDYSNIIKNIVDCGGKYNLIEYLK